MIVWIVLGVIAYLASLLLVLALCFAAGRADELDEAIERHLREKRA